MFLIAAIFRSLIFPGCNREIFCTSLLLKCTKTNLASFVLLHLSKMFCSLLTMVLLCFRVCNLTDAPQTL